ncbi:hypothetical protein L208DRAFT_338845 [Tricholoma matsutake]|nr:hypothetical protein L208DRAFT_338845 [Tricholoma matsutake 945]
MGGIVGCGVERYPTCLRLSESIKHICLLTPPLPIRYSRLSRIHLPTSSTYYLPREGGSAHCQIVLHAHEQIRSRGPPHSQHPASLSSGVVMSITIYVQAFPGAPNPGFVFLSVGMRQSRRRRCCMSWLLNRSNTEMRAIIIIFVSRHTLNNTRCWLRRTSSANITAITHGGR